MFFEFLGRHIARFRFKIKNVLLNVEQPRTGGFPDLCGVCERAIEWLISVGSRYYTIDLREENDDNTKLLRLISDARKRPKCNLCAFLIGLLGRVDSKERETLRNLGPRSEDQLRFWFRAAGSTSVDISCRFESRPEFEACQRERVFFNLGIFGNTIQGNDIDRVTSGIRHRPGSTIEYSKITEWISCCEKTHYHTYNADWIDRVLEKLVNVNGLKFINSKTFEIHTIEPGDTILPYAALSYVWGPRQLQNWETLECKTSSMPRICLDSLPRTLKESILLARDLELPYIWIDRICIDQNISSETKSIALQAMGAIYAAANLVIAAAAGNDANAGLPGTKGHDRYKEHWFRTLDQSGALIELIPYRSDFDHSLSNSTWAERGWTFQEYVFARRALVVFPDEMFFVCGNSALQREAFTQNASIDHISYILSAEADRSWQMRRFLAEAKMFSWEAYAETVKQFTQRDLTFEKDRLDAFKGMMLDHGDGQHDISVATGLPMRYFGPALTWLAVQSRDNSRDWVPSIAPSWSWCSAGAAVRYDLVHVDPGVNCFLYTALPHRKRIIVGRPSDEYLHNTVFPRTDPVTIQSLIPERDLVSQEAITIHLATLVFHAYLRTDGMEYYFNLVGWDRYRLQCGVDIWHQGVIRTGRILCAVVSATEIGDHSIMLLHRTGDHYERAGMCTVNDEKLATILKAKDANPSWAYIKLR